MRRIFRIAIAFLSIIVLTNATGLIFDTLLNSMGVAFGLLTLLTVAIGVLSYLLSMSFKSALLTNVVIVFGVSACSTVQMFLRMAFQAWMMDTFILTLSFVYIIIVLIVSTKLAELIFKGRK